MITKINSGLVLEIKPETEDEARMLELWYNIYKSKKMFEIVTIYFEVEK